MFAVKKVLKQGRSEKEQTTREKAKGLIKRRVAFLFFFFTPFSFCRIRVVCICLPPLRMVSGQTERKEGALPNKERESSFWTELWGVVLLQIVKPIPCEVISKK